MPILEAGSSTERQDHRQPKRYGEIEIELRTHIRIGVVGAVLVVRGHDPVKTAGRM